MSWKSISPPPPGWQVLASHLAQLVMVEAEYLCPLRDYLQECCKNLVGLINKFKDKCCWGDDLELTTCDKMDTILTSNLEPVEEEQKEEVRENEKDGI